MRRVSSKNGRASDSSDGRKFWGGRGHLYLQACITRETNKPIKKIAMLKVCGCNNPAVCNSYLVLTLWRSNIIRRHIRAEFSLSTKITSMRMAMRDLTQGLRTCQPNTFLKKLLQIEWKPQRSCSSTSNLEFEELFEFGSSPQPGVEAMNELTSLLGRRWKISRIIWRKRFVVLSVNWGGSVFYTGEEQGSLSVPVSQRNTSTTHIYYH